MLMFSVWEAKRGCCRLLVAVISGRVDVVVEQGVVAVVEDGVVVVEQGVVLEQGVVVVE